MVVSLAKLSVLVMDIAARNFSVWPRNMQPSWINNNTRFGSLDSSYLVSGDICDAQPSLFHFPYFDPAVLQAYEDTKATVTLGVLLTLQPAPAFELYYNTNQNKLLASHGDGSLRVLL